MGKTRFLAVAACVAAVVGVGASAALAGEINGNGQYIAGSNDAPLNGKSACAYSGQEDLQYVDANGVPLADPQKGVPGHAQSWGQIDHATRDFLTSIGMNPGIACNPTKAGAGGP